MSRQQRHSLAELEREARATGPAYGAGAAVVCDGLVRIYRTDDVEVVALQGLDLVVERGGFVAVVGASGSGKSTLLGILAGVDRPTAGVARVGGQDLLTMSSRQRLHYRRRVVGLVWQQSERNLLPYLTAGENAALPMLLARTPRRERRPRAEQLLEAVGAGYCRDRRPAELSGGEQQRVAVAVALANAPQVLLADEPTGELDTAGAGEVLGALRAVNRDLGVTVLVVTHDPLVATTAERTVAIRDGRTSTEVLRRAGSDAEEYAVLDRAGRVQLPREYVEALQLRERVRLHLEEDHVQVRPGEVP